MANRNIKIYGHNHAADSAAVVTFGGVEVHNGALTASVTAQADVWAGTATQLPIFEFNHNNADDSILTEHAMLISVTAGSISAGPVWIEATDNDVIGNANENIVDVEKIDSEWYFVPSIKDNNNVSAYKTEAGGRVERYNILINDETPVIVGHDAADTIYDGREFILASGENKSCTVRVPAKLTS